jgi:hypothetical protein
VSVRRGPSNRSFGFVLAAVLLVLGGRLGYQRSEYIRMLTPGCLLLLVTLLMPRLLAPFKRLWLRLGTWLSVIVSPVVLTVIYVAVISSLGAVMRMFGKDPLSLRHDPTKQSYWVPRLPAEARSLKNQF